MDSHQDHPPANREAEAVVLGSLLRDGSLMDEAMSVLREPACFYSTEYRTIFQAMVNVHSRRQPIDVPTVRDELVRLDKLDKIGGTVNLIEMMELTTDLLAGVASSAHFPAHAQIVWDKYRLRQLILVSNETVRSCYTESDDAETILGNAQSELFRLATGDNHSGVSLAYDELAGVYESLEARKDGTPPLGSVQTPFTEVNKILEPYEKGTYNIIAGARSTGKSQFACQLAEYVSVTQIRPVLFLSWEMTRSRITTRIACDVANVDKTKAKHGELTQEDWNALVQAQTVIHEAPLFLADIPNMDLHRIWAESRQLKATSGLDLLIIDYAQLVTVPGRWRTDNERLEHLSRSLKLLCMELDLPIVVISQLNRGGKDRRSARPQLFDLRGSGAFEQDADSVVFTWHDSKNSYITIAKNREGPRGETELRFDRGRWYSGTRDYDIPY